MERQLKERLIGAAVLIALAVVLVPEMFSGPASHSTSEPSLPAHQADASSAATDQVKSWRVDLRDMPAASASTSSTEASDVDPPAPAPQDEVMAMSAASSAPANVPPAPTAAATQVTSSQASVPVVTAEKKPDAKPEARPEPKTEKKPDLKPEVKAEPRIEPKAEPKAAVSKSLAGSWKVQVGSFSTEAKARQVADQLKAKGFAAEVARVEVKGKTLYRVRVAGGDSRTSAQAVLAKLAQPYPGASVVSPDK